MTDSRKFSLSNYPLCWPDGWKRTESHRRKIAHFKRHGYRATVSLGLDRILEELRSMGISIETEFRFLDRERHPDMGGTDELMAELNMARAEALEEVG
jgi:hypothetical protein